MADFETRLDNLREEARRTGTVREAGLHAVGGPMPDTTAPNTAAQPGYYGLPFLKEPVWEWMIAAYFFIGGLAGMSALIGSAALIKSQWELARAAMWAAAMGALVSPVLLTWDLGRPWRFVYMLRVFKYQSPMSLGSWILTGFGAFAVPGLIFTELYWRSLQTGGTAPILHIFATYHIIGAGLCGIFLATYTGALLAVTAIPAWNLHRILLPFHFGIAGLGSAAAVLELAGFHLRQMVFIAYFSSIVQLLVFLTLELRRHGPADRALHEGSSGWVLRAGEVLEGPLALLLRLLGLAPFAAGAFALGALITRFGWLAAGRQSAKDPESVLASQAGDRPLAQARKPWLMQPTVASGLSAPGKGRSA